MSDTEVLAELEARRCEALMAGDDATLEKMLSEDLVHVHLSGAADTKAGYMDGFRNRYLFRDVRRGDLSIRLFGDAAVMTGPLTQVIVIRETGEERAVRATTTQVWNRSGGGWVLNTCHNAPLTA